MNNDTKNKQIIGVLVGIVLLIIAGILLYFFVFNKNFNNNDSNNSNFEENNEISKDFIFAYLDYDNSIYLLNSDNKVFKTYIKTKNAVMKNGLKYDNNKLYYLDDEGFVHSFDLMNLKDNKTGIKIYENDSNTDETTFYVKDNNIVYVNSNNQVVKVNLDTKKEIVYSTSSIMNEKLEFYYNFYKDTVYIDRFSNLFDPSETVIVDGNGFTRKIPYTVYDKEVNNDNIIVSTNDKDCVYNFKNESVSNCVEEKTDVIDEDNWYEIKLYKDTIVYMFRDEIYEATGYSDKLLYKLDENVQYRDSFNIFPTRDGILLRAGKTISCNEGCQYNYKFYHITDNKIVEVDNLKDAEIDSYVVIDKSNY